MHECSKALPSAQDDFRSDCVERASKQGNDGCGPSGPCPEPRPQQTAMEYFAKAMAELLGCRSCYVAMISSSGLEEVRNRRRPYRSVMHDDGCANCAQGYRRGRCLSRADQFPDLVRPEVDRRSNLRQKVIQSLAGLLPVSEPLSYSWPDGDQPRLRQPRFPVWRIPCARYGRLLIHLPGKRQGMSMRRSGSKS